MCEGLCFRFLIFNLSGPCELLFLLCFIASWTWEVSECDVVSLYVVCCSVNGSVCFVCCVFVLLFHLIIRERCASLFLRWKVVTWIFSDCCFCNTAYGHPKLLQWRTYLQSLNAVGCGMLCMKLRVQRQIGWSIVYILGGSCFSCILWFICICCRDP